MFEICSPDYEARAIRESGDWPREWSFTRGNGFDVQLLKAVVGHSPEAFDQTIQAGEFLHITAEECIDVYNAIAFANALGRILNTHISITWSTVGLADDAQIQAATARLLHSLEATCAQHNFPVAWVSVMERGKKRGLHTHILMSCRTEWIDQLSIWLRESVASIAHLKPLIGTAGETVSVKANEERNTNIQWSIFRYLMKGMDPAATHKFATGIRPLAETLGIALKDQGAFVGKRVRIAGLLAAPERTRRGYSSFLDEGCASPFKLYSSIYYSNRTGFLKVGSS